jgi:hypothetical protein
MTKLIWKIAENSLFRHMVYIFLLIYILIMYLSKYDCLFYFDPIYFVWGGVEGLGIKSRDSRMAGQHRATEPHL